MGALLGALLIMEKQLGYLENIGKLDPLEFLVQNMKTTLVL